MTPSLNRPYQEYPILVGRLENKASPEILDTDPSREEKDRER
jgi:hypothetical protein